MTRSPAGLVRSTSTVIPETCGKRPPPSSIWLTSRSRAHARCCAPVNLELHGLVAERQLGEDVAARELRARRVFAVGADAAAVGDCHVGADGLAHGVGDQVADRRLLASHGGAARVERRLRRPDLDRELLVELVLVGRTTAAISGSGSTADRVDDAQTPASILRDLAVLLGLVDGDRGDHDVVALAFRFCQRGLPL